MFKDKRKMADQENVFLKGALKVILGALTGLGIFLVIAVHISDPEASYADRLQEAACNLLDECDNAGPATLDLNQPQ